MDIATIFQNVLKILGKYWDVFLIEGLTNTLSLSAITVFFGAIFGALLALGKKTENTPPTEEHASSRPLSGEGAPQH